MTITFPRALPASPGFSRSRFGGVAAVARTRSPFSFAEQVQAHPGRMWLAELSLPPMLRAQAAEWAAWLLSLNGAEKTFLMGDPDAKTPRGTWAGTPLVDGASQSGTTIDIKGLSNGATVKPGDYFQLGSGADAELKMNLSDLTAGAGGTLTLDIWPQIRTAPADGAAIVTSSPAGVWRLSSNRMSWDADELSRFGVSFSAFEAL